MSKLLENMEIYKLVDICLKDEDITNYEVGVPEASEKGEGFATNVLFIKVKGTQKSNGEPKQMDLVFKVSKVFKEQHSMQELYKKEPVVYEKVFPEYKKFTKGKKPSEIFRSVPKCLKTFSFDNRDIVVLENLRSLGYEAHDRFSPMNLNHIKLVLKNYARFHAITYAFRDQKPKEFNNLFSNYVNVYSKMVDGDLRPHYHQKVSTARDMIQEVDIELAQKLEDTVIQTGVAEVLEKLFKEDVVESTVTHGDCWNSNFLFKYNNNDKTSPTEAIILDWQLSSIHSPVIDLSYFLFSVSSNEQIAHFEELLKYYYDHLSDSIRDLGSAPEKLFSFAIFYEHWKKFSLAGLITSIIVLSNVLSDTKDLKDMGDVVDSERFLDSLKNDGTKNNVIYRDRILATIKYYFDLIANH